MRCLTGLLFDFFKISVFSYVWVNMRIFVFIIGWSIGFTLGELLHLFL